MSNILPEAAFCLVQSNHECDRSSNDVRKEVKLFTVKMQGCSSRRRATAEREEDHKTKKNKQSHVVLQWREPRRQKVL